MRCTVSAIAGTGTLAVAPPLGPMACKRTCQEPEAISQSEPVKNAGSSAERFIGSGVGGCRDASPVSGIGVIDRALSAGPATRTSTVATPGTTVGGRTVTKNW